MRTLRTLYPDGLILRVTIISLFRLINTFTAKFGSPSTRILSSVTAITFVEFCLFGHTSLGQAFHITHRQMCSVFSLGPLQASKMGPFEKIFGSFTCYCDKGIHATLFQDSIIHL